MATVYLGVGANVGQRRTQISRALRLLSRTLHITAISPIYETAAWGVEDQPDFLNLCISAETTLSPADLLALLRDVEQTIGRQARPKWHAREIDLDILLYDDLIIDTESLTLPHPHMLARPFVLHPLADLAPQLIHPVTGQRIAARHAQLQADRPKREATIPLPNRFQWGKRTYIMGIINATPDSFSGDGLMRTPNASVERAVAQAVQMVADGADIIDVGAESTRPGGEEVDGSSERERLLPALRAIRAAVTVPISVDTYRAETARQALEAGADWINDIWGFKHNADIAQVAAEAGCPVILMHNGRNRPRIDHDDGTGGYYGYFDYDDLRQEVHDELLASADIALKAGVLPHNIILDPGIGFGKTGPQNLELLRHLSEVMPSGYPVLLGASRKGFIGHALGGVAAAERVEGTIATTVTGISHGIDIVRVHDVLPNKRAALMADALYRLPN